MLDKRSFIKAIRKRPAWVLLPAFERGLFNRLSDESFLKLQYWAYTGEKLHTDPPVTFNEKIAWLKIHDHRGVYQVLADKYSARDFVAEHLGKTWLVSLLGVWKRFDDIDFCELPDRFVLKCSHGYGSTVLCRDKSNMDFEAARATLNKAMETNYYQRSREWAYGEALPRIMAEELIDDSGGPRPADYKFMCFNGKVLYVCVSRGLGDFDTGSLSFFHADGSPAPFRRADYPEGPPDQKPPQHLRQMNEAAETLAQAADLPFVRVDFYETDGRVFFSEFTFYPCGGTIFFDPPEYNRALGDKLILPLTPNRNG
jgi:hypothetical protein